MIRATTGGVMKSYRYNLMNSFINQNKARDTVLTKRNFNSYAEDPAAAAKAFRLRKSRMTVDSQHSICSDTLKKFEAASSCLQSVNEVLTTKDGVSGAFMNTLHGATLEWLNDPTGDAREQLGKALDQMSESLIQTMNQKYGDNFIFAGADGHNVPFEIRQVDGKNKLYYRGVPVDAEVPKLKQDANGDPVELGIDRYILDTATLIEKPDVDTTNTVTGADGIAYYLKTGAATPIDKVAYDALLSEEDKAEYTEIPSTTTPPGDPTYYKTSDLVNKADHDKLLDSTLKQADGTTPEEVTIDGKAYYIEDNDKAVISQADYDTAKNDAEKLTYLAGEKYFVDIGLGFQENESGKLIETSGFNAALNGINFLGYGLDEDGDPKNLYSLVQEMKNLCDSVPPGGSWDSVYDDFHRLVGKFENRASDFCTEFINTDASVTKLKTNEKLLEDNFYSLQEQYSELEDVDMVDAITAFLYAKYSYNAALKMGNNVLSQSLMDYLN